jgi:hypothetical protein
MQGAAEEVTSVDVEAGELVAGGDRFGQRAQGRGSRQGAVGPAVVQLPVLARGVQKAGLVPHQGAVETSGAAGTDPPVP